MISGASEKEDPPTMGCGLSGSAGSSAIAGEGGRRGRVRGHGRLLDHEDLNPDRGVRALLALDPEGDAVDTTSGRARSSSHPGIRTEPEVTVRRWLIPMR